MPIKSPQTKSHRSLKVDDSTPAEFRNLQDGEFVVQGANPAVADQKRFHSEIGSHQALDWPSPMECLQNSKDSPIQSHIILKPNTRTRVVFDRVSHVYAATAKSVHQMRVNLLLRATSAPQGRMRRKQ